MITITVAGDRTAPTYNTSDYYGLSLLRRLGYDVGQWIFDPEDFSSRLIETDGIGEATKRRLQQICSRASEFNAKVAAI